MTARDPSPPLLRLLGQPAWSADGRTWHRLPRKDAVLLALLALEGPQARGRVAALLWPGVPPPRANANLRQRLFRLRQQAAGLIDESDEGLALAGAVQCDVRGALPAGEAPPAALLEALPAEDDELQPWIDDARHLWAADAGTRLAAQAARLEAAGDLAAAIATAERLLAQDPLHEHAWRLLIHLHVQRRDRAAAVAAFERCEQVLRAELGVRPSPPTLALLHRAETLPAAVPGAAPAWPAALLRPPPLVGRAAERTAMQGAWEAGRGFVLVGEAGLGKTRLLGAWAAAHEGCVLESARPGDELSAYGVMVRLLRGLQRTAVRPQALWPEGAARHELARLLPELGAPPAAPGLQALLHDAVEQAFARAPGAGVHAVLLDDLQHADDASLTLLRRLAGPGALRWGLASRPEPRVDLPGWLATSARLQRIDLAPLAAADQRQLLRSLQLPGLDATALGDALARHCGGNPLFLLETLRHMAGLPAGAVDRLPLPASVHAVLAERLARLPAEALSLARVAAVAGPDFDAAVACDVLGQSALALAAPWQALHEAQVLEGERFAHESVFDAVLAGLPAPLRAPLHAAVATSLRRRGGAARRVARHFADARHWPEAAEAALEAAAHALRVGRMAERLAMLDDAARWFESGGRAGAAFEARLAGVAPLLATQGLQAARERLAALEPLAAAPAERVAVQLDRAALALEAYEVAALLQAARSARAGAEPGSEGELRALALLAAGEAWSGDTAAAGVTLDAVLPRLAEVASPLQAALLWSHVAVAQHACGRVQGCMHALEHQRRLAAEAGHAELEASALASLSGQHCQIGDAERAIEQARSAGALQRRMGAEHTAVLSDINLAIPLIGTYRLAEALEVTAGAALHLQQAAAASDLPLIVADLRADIWLRLGDAAAALAELAHEPADMNIARRINRLVLRARAAGLAGDGPAARAGWATLRAALPPAGQGGVRLRALLLLAAHAPGADAEAAVDEALAGAAATGLLALEALARLLRAERALAAGDAAGALAEARRLQALRPRARHLYVDEAHLRATVCRALCAAGLQAEGRAERQAAQAWVEAEVLPQLPPGHRQRWLAREELAVLGG